MLKFDMQCTVNILLTQQPELECQIVTPQASNLVYNSVS